VNIRISDSMLHTLRAVILVYIITEGQ
jgi:hypothetical protein